MSNVRAGLAGRNKWARTMPGHIWGRRRVIFLNKSYLGIFTQTNAITYFVKVKILKNKDNGWTYLGTVSAFFTDLKCTDSQIPWLQKWGKRETLPTSEGHH